MCVDAEKIPHRVVVFRAVQAARGDASGIGWRQLVDPIEFLGEPSSDRLTLVLGWLRFFFRRHLARPKLLDDFSPSLVLVSQRSRGLVRFEIQSVLLFLESVAGNAVLGNERTNDAVEAVDGLFWRFPQRRFSCRRRRPRFRELG